MIEKDGQVGLLVKQLSQTAKSELLEGLYLNHPLRQHLEFSAIFNRQAAQRSSQPDIRQISKAFQCKLLEGLNIPEFFG